MILILFEIRMQRCEAKNYIKTIHRQLKYYVFNPTRSRTKKMIN